MHSTHTENLMRRRKSRLDLGRHAVLDDSRDRGTNRHRKGNRRLRQDLTSRSRQLRGRSGRSGGHGLASRVRVVHDLPRSRRGGLGHVDFQFDVRGRSSTRRDGRGDGVKRHHRGVCRSVHRNLRRVGLLHRDVRVRDVAATGLYLGCGRVAVISANRNGRRGGTASDRRTAGTSRTPAGR